MLFSGAPFAGTPLASGSAHAVSSGDVTCAIASTQGQTSAVATEQSIAATVAGAAGQTGNVAGTQSVIATLSAAQAQTSSAVAAQSLAIALAGAQVQTHSAGGAQSLAAVAAGAQGQTSDMAARAVVVSIDSAQGQTGALVAQLRIDASVTSAQGQTGSGTVNQTASSYTISASRANLIYQIAMLHGLDAANPMSVSHSARTAGTLIQAVSGTDTVTITTSSTPSVMPGSVDDWIDALAALHALTTPLVVTASTRSSGSVVQTIVSTGNTSTITTA